MDIGVKYDKILRPVKVDKESGEESQDTVFGIQGTHYLSEKAYAAIFNFSSK